MAPQIIKTGDVFTPAGYYYYGLEAPHELAHWPLFFQWLVGSAVACALIMAITRLLLPRQQPRQQVIQGAGLRLRVGRVGGERAASVQ